LTWVRVYAPTFKIHGELVLFQSGIRHPSAKVFSFRTFNFGANEGDRESQSNEWKLHITEKD